MPTADATNVTNSTNVTGAEAGAERPPGPLTRDRVLAGALELADSIGIEPFTIRKPVSYTHLTLPTKIV